MFQVKPGAAAKRKWLRRFGNLALMAAMTSEKVGPGLLSFIGQNPFAITRFSGFQSYPAGLVALSLIGVTYGKATHAAPSWDARIPPIVDDVSRSMSRACPTALNLWLALGGERAALAVIP
jgi:hypothetical protein